jgi:PAS domain S-box-containing protein
MKTAGRSQTMVDPSEPGYFELGELFSRARDAVIVGDAETGRVVLWNDAATTLFGYTAEEASGLLMEDLIPESFKQAHRTGLQRFARSGHGAVVDSGRVVELPAVRKDGSDVSIELSLTPMGSERLDGRYVMAIVRDVTERKKMLERLQDLDELKNTFIATMAHDVRSPMAAVGGFAEILRAEWGELQEKDRERVLDGISRSAATVGRLADDVLVVAALDSGEVPYEKQAVDLDSAIANVLQEMRAANPSLAFDTQNHSSGARVWADPVRLWQVLTNLLSNAVAFSPDEGRVEVSVRRMDDLMEVSVHDQGPGIEIGDRARLFQAFSQIAEPASGTRNRSTGLGLYICRVIVQAHGGAIWLESTPEAGTRFSFTIPIAD